MTLGLSLALVDSTSASSSSSPRGSLSVCLKSSLPSSRGRSTTRQLQKPTSTVRPTLVASIIGRPNLPLLSTYEAFRGCACVIVQELDPRACADSSFRQRHLQSTAFQIHRTAWTASALRDHNGIFRGGPLVEHLHSRPHSDLAGCDQRHLRRAASGPVRPPPLHIQRPLLRSLVPVRHVMVVDQLVCPRSDGGPEGREGETAGEGAR